MRLLLGIPTYNILLNNLLAIHFIIPKNIFLFSSWIVMQPRLAHVPQVRLNDLQMWTAHSWWCLACCCLCTRVIFKRERHTPGDVWHVVVCISVWSSNVNGTLLVMFGMLLSVYPCDLQTWTAHSWWCLACCCQCIRVIFKRERHTPGDVWHVVVSVSVWSSNVNGTLLVMFGMLLSVYPCDLQTWTAHSWWCLACCCLCIRVIFKRERHTPGDVWHVVVCVSVWSSNVNGTLLVMLGMLLSVYPCDLQMWTARSWWCLACCCLCIRVTSYNGSVDIALLCMLYHIQLLSIGTVSFLSESTCVLWAHSCPANVSRIGHRDTILCSVHVST